MKGGRSGSRRSRDLLLIVRPEQSGPENLLSLSLLRVFTSVEFTRSRVSPTPLLWYASSSRVVPCRVLLRTKTPIGPPRFPTIRGRKREENSLATDDFTDARLQRGTKPPPPPPRGSLSSLRRETYRKVSKREGERECVCVCMYVCIYVYVLCVRVRVCGWSAACDEWKDARQRTRSPGRRVLYRLAYPLG